MAIIVLWGAISHSVHRDQSHVIQTNSSQNKLLFCSFVASMKLSLQVPFYISGSSVLDGITLNCENPAGAFDAGIFKTGLISSNNTTVFYTLRPKPAVLALIFLIHCLALGLDPSGQATLSICLHC